jgi:hypothetical protein
LTNSRKLAFQAVRIHREFIAAIYPVLEGEDNHLEDNHLEDNHLAKRPKGEQQRWAEEQASPRNR